MIALLKRPVVVAVTSALMISGCETLQVSQQEIGRVTGAITGAVIGSKVADDDNKQMGILLGALIGGYVGDRIGKHLDDKDKERLALETRNTLQTGKSTEWENPETGVKGQVVVKETQKKQSQSQVKVLKDRVEQVPPLDLRESGVYAVKKDSNVRGGPSTQYKVVDKLKSSSTVNVLGKVENSSWYLVGSGDVAKGFVYATLLEPTGESISAVADNPVADSETASVEVATVGNCRTVEQSVTLQNGNVVTDTITACQQPDGSWS